MQEPRFGIGMRWWLAALFALIAALTAILVAEVFTRQANDALRGRAEELTAGSALATAETVRQGLERGNVADVVAVASQRRRLDLFVHDAQGRLVAGAHGASGAGAPDLRRDALATALAGDRFVRSTEDGRRIVVALPIRETGGALVVGASRPDLVEAAGVVRGEIVRAALWAVAVAALVGLVVAVAIASRLRRIAAVATAIEAGSFDTPLRPSFLDEVGEVAQIVERMRLRLRASFESLENERDKLRRLLDQLQEGVVAVDADGIVRAANGHAARFVPGVREGEPLADPFARAPVARMTGRLFDAGARPAEVRLETGDGRVLAVAGVPAGPHSETAVLVFRDLTEQERRERAEREFVSNAAHELRTPLAGITNAVEVLQSGAKDVPADRDHFLGVIERQAARLGRLTRALLVLARAQTRHELPPLEPVALEPLLAEAAAGVGDDVRVVCPPGLRAMGNRDLLEQAVANLAANAVKHGAGEVILAARPDGAFVAIEVSDDGAGIPAGDRERIFDRFYSARGGDRDGFGLGLAIVRESVRAVGGTIELDSAAGRGTTVRIRLAAATREAVA